MEENLEYLDNLARRIEKKFEERINDTTPLPDDGLHVPVSTNQALDNLMLKDVAVHSAITCAINHRESAKTYWDTNLLKKAIDKSLKNEFNGKLTYDVSSNTIDDVDYMYVDVALDNKVPKHRHIFRLSPFGFVETSHFYDDTKETKLNVDAELHKRYPDKMTRAEARKYYSSMKNKSWKE